MSAITFDTLKYTKRLEAAGYSREQAEAQVEVQRQVIEDIIEAETGKLVTKEDLIKEISPMKIDIAVLKWGMGVVIALNVSILLKIFFS